MERAYNLLIQCWFVYWSINQHATEFNDRLKNYHSWTLMRRRKAKQITLRRVSQKFYFRIIHEKEKSFYHNSHIFHFIQSLFIYDKSITVICYVRINLYSHFHTRSESQARYAIGPQDVSSDLKTTLFSLYKSILNIFYNNIIIVHENNVCSTPRVAYR